MGTPTEEMVRWNIKVSRDTDHALRTFLGARGMKKGDLSKFIEGAVRAEVFHRRIEDLKLRNAADDPAKVQEEIDEAVQAVRKRRAAASVR